MSKKKPDSLPVDLTSYLPDFLTVPEAATHLNVHTDTVRRLIRSGRLEAYRVGRVIRIPKTAVISALEPAAPWAVA